MRRPLAFLVSGLFALALLGGSLGTVSPASAATIGPTTECNNGVLNAGGQGAVCEVTVVNTITPTGGSAVVTVRECQGSAAVPDATCPTLTTTSLSAPVTAVNQCNGSINGAGGVLLCSVVITNNFVGISPSPTVTSASVNQCVGSADMGSLAICDPVPASVSGATITQCNGSANGGGSTLTCTATGTQSSGLAVSINQCNGSSNGGGTRTVCNATMTNNILAAATPTPAPTATPAPGATARPTARPTAPPTNTAELGSAQSGTAVLLVLGLVFLSALSLIAVARRPTRSR